MRATGCVYFLVLHIVDTVPVLQVFKIRSFLVWPLTKQFVDALASSSSGGFCFVPWSGWVLCTMHADDVNSKSIEESKLL